MRAAVLTADDARKRALLIAPPDLAGKAARAGALMPPNPLLVQVVRCDVWAGLIGGPI
jgi:hypothetical protein